MASYRPPISLSCDKIQPEIKLKQLNVLSVLVMVAWKLLTVLGSNVCFGHAFLCVCWAFVGQLFGSKFAPSWHRWLAPFFHWTGWVEHSSDEASKGSCESCVFQSGFTGHGHGACLNFFLRSWRWKHMFSIVFWSFRSWHVLTIYPKWRSYIIL